MTDREGCSGLESPLFGNGTGQPCSQKSRTKGRSTLGVLPVLRVGEWEGEKWRSDSGRRETERKSGVKGVLIITTGIFKQYSD